MVQRECPLTPLVAMRVDCVCGLSRGILHAIVAPDWLAPSLKNGGDRIQDDMFTGLDVDKATISVAVAQDKRGGEVRHRGRCRTGTSSNLGSSIGGADLAP